MDIREERKETESKTGVARCALDRGEGCADVSGAVLATFSFKFVVLQNTGMEGKKSERFPIFVFLHSKHFFWRRVDGALTSAICFCLPCLASLGCSGC